MNSFQTLFNNLRAHPHETKPGPASADQLGGCCGGRSTEGLRPPFQSSKSKQFNRDQALIKYCRIQMVSILQLAREGKLVEINRIAVDTVRLLNSRGGI